VTSDIANKVNELKSQPGKDIWLYGGASLITTFMNLGLVDNYLLAVHPVILGGGKPLFSDLKDRTNLKLNGVVTSKSGVILVDYEKQ
jgi:dihydrofolate reductase